MDAELSAEQEELRASVRRYLADAAPITPWVRDRLGDATGTTPDVWEGLTALGIPGVLVPAADGGAGGTLVDAGAVLEELGRALHPGPVVGAAVATPVLLTALTTTTGAGAPTTAEPATATTARPGWAGDLLRATADGRARGAVAVWERDAAWSWEAPGTVATPVADRHEVRVTGEKAWVLDAAAASHLLVVADLADPTGADQSNADPGGGARDGDGPCVVLVHAAGAGVDVEPVATSDRTRRRATVHLDGAVGTVVGRPGPATTAAVRRTLDAVAVALVADGLGAAQRALELALDHAHHRHQFGVPIGTFQAVQHLCADLYLDVELTRAALYEALWAFDAAPARAGRLAAQVAGHAAEHLSGVGATLVQVLGGVGFTWDHDAHLFDTRLLALEHLSGDADHHADAVARALFAD